MAKKGKSTAKSSGQKAGATKSKPASKKKAPQPTLYYHVCPHTNQNVYIGKATLKDLKAKSTYANSSRKRLWTLPSPQVRNDLYLEAANAIAQVEQSLLPSFGMRSWEVTCKLTEPSWSGQVLFRAWKGQMELAALPHLLEKIPTPPTWPGRRATPDEYEEEEDGKRLQQREVSSLSSVAWDLKNSYPVPTVTLKWQSPDRKIFNSRKSAWEYATAMAAREVEINKCLLGTGASGKLLKPFIPSASTALKVGKLRFERDGLWVVGQELGWQEERPEKILEEEAAEEERRNSIVPKSGLALYLMRKREEYRETREECTTLKQAETELRKIWKTLPRAEQKEWNRQVRGDDEESSESEEEPEENEKIDIEEKIVEPEPEPEPKPEPVKLSMTPLAFYVKSCRHAYREERKAQKWSISLSECDIWLRQKWKELERTVQQEWKEKLISYETARAEEKAKAERDAREAEEAKAAAEAEQKEAEDQAKASAPDSLVSDLLFVPPDSKPNGEVSAREADCVTESATTESQPQQKSTTQSLVTNLGNQPDLPVLNTGTEQVIDTKSSQDVVKDSSSNHRSTAVEVVKKTENTIDVRANESSVIKEKTELTIAVEAKAESATETSQASNKCQADVDDEEEKKDDETAPRLSSASNRNEDVSTAVAVSRVSSTHIDEQVPVRETDRSSPALHVQSSTEAVKTNPKSVTRKSAGSSKKQYVPTKKVTERWCMSQKQIDLCFAACMEHYDTVMRTVKARDLHRELQDGFDVFRERGHGRYDMELPAFDDPKTFGFLTDMKKAPWMPVVKAILGDDAILIHKGCFLSIPGAAPQEYHQDGVHLTTQTQRPCHAVNVFVPLVDLNSRNGPTEFCLGSHILGLEGYDRDFVEIPKPKAGNPVIFDYRLGHRGLGNNSSRSCRPIVYCTYARASQGKEFRDSVNFSRKRYHKIGELSAKPMSREERRNKRKRSSLEKEEEELQRAKEESTEKAITESEGESAGDSDKARNKEADSWRVGSKVTSLEFPDQGSNKSGGSDSSSEHDATSVADGGSGNSEKVESQQGDISVPIQKIAGSTNEK